MGDTSTQRAIGTAALAACFPARAAQGITGDIEFIGRIAAQAARCRRSAVTEIFHPVARILSAIDDAIARPGAVTELPVTPSRMRELLR